MPHYPARCAVAPSPAWGTRKTCLLSGHPHPPNGRPDAPSRGCRRCAGPPRVRVNQPPALHGDFGESRHSESLHRIRGARPALGIDGAGDPLRASGLRVDLPQPEQCAAAGRHPAHAASTVA